MESTIIDGFDLLTPDHFKNLSRKTSSHTLHEEHGNVNIFDPSIIHQSQPMYSNLPANTNGLPHPHYPFLMNSISQPLPSPSGLLFMDSPNSSYPISPSKIDILHLLAQKDNSSSVPSPSSSVPIPSHSVVYDSFSHSPSTSSPIKIPATTTNVQSDPRNLKSPRKSTSPSRSTSPPGQGEQRWAGAAFFNSPDPSNLPIPSFGLTPKQQSLKSLDPSILTFSPKGSRMRGPDPVVKEEHHAHLSTSLPVSNGNFGPQRDLSPNAHSQPTTPIGKKSRSFYGDSSDLQSSSSPSSPKKSNKRHQRNPSWNQTSHSQYASKTILKRQSSAHMPSVSREHESSSSNQRTSPPRMQPAQQRRSSSTSPTRQTNSDSTPSSLGSSSRDGSSVPNGDFDHMSNHLKMMLNICSA